MQKFLTARWKDLIMANYEVDPSILIPRLPAGTELDLQDGKCFVSLVGFMFLDTRVLGIPIPFHVNFEEVNLRFYNKREVDGETRRAVCFVKEIVPRFAIATVARVMYGEPYECWTMSHERTETTVSYDWSKGGSTNHLSVDIGESIGVPAAGSHGEFIIEHYWLHQTRRLTRRRIQGRASKMGTILGQERRYRCRFRRYVRRRVRISRRTEAVFGLAGKRFGGCGL